MSPYVVGGLNNRRFIDPFYIARPAWEKGIHGSENGINGRYSAHRDAIPPLEVLQKEVDKLQFRKKLKILLEMQPKNNNINFCVLNKEELDEDTRYRHNIINVEL